MPGKKVRFYDVHKAVQAFNKAESKQDASGEEKYKLANEVLELSASYLEDLGVDVAQPFDAEAFIQMAKGKSGRNEREEVVKAFRYSFQWVDRYHQIKNEAKEKPIREENARREAARREAYNMSPPPANPNRDWYNKTFKNSMRRPGGGEEFSESNPLDWQRLRVLRDGKLVPAMGEVHFGVPNAMQLELLRDEAKKGNLFFYRLGEEYPQHLVGDTWHSTDPAIKEEKPQIKLPEPPKPPQPYTGTLEDELKARGLSPLLANVSSVNQIQNEDARKRFMEAHEAWNDKKTAASMEQNQYQQKLKEYEAQRAQLTKELDTKVREWEKNVKAYDQLNIGIKRAINDEVPQRSADIRRNQEAQRAADIDARPLMEWYHNEFRASMVRNSGAVDLVESDGMDWSRVRIWDGEKFARALPEGHTGVPSAEALKNLREAAQNGNLFMYQRGDKYPSKWTGKDWSSMDKSWIDRCKPTEVKDLRDKPIEPVNRAGAEPRLEDFTNNISSARLAINRALRFTFRGTRQAYLNAQNTYAQEKERYDNALAEYNRELEVYNEQIGLLQSDYNRRMAAYEYMLKNYEGLTPEQRAAMENDAAQRAEEIKNNKEIQVKKAEDALVQEQNIRNLLDAASKRMGIIEPKPQQEQFLNPAGMGQQPLGQNAYEMVAPRGYDLPPNSRITPEEASMIHIALAGSAQAAINGGLSPLSAAQYGQMLDGVLYGRPNDGDWKYIAASYDTAKGCINSYESGNPQALADALSAGLRNLIAVGRGRLELTPEMAGLAKLTERILDVMDRHQQLRENCSLSKEEMNFARGMVELGHIYSNALAAKVELTKQATGAQTLSPQQVQAHATDLFLNNATKNIIKNDQQGILNMVNTMGTGGNVMNTVRFTYQNDPTLQAFANNPQNLIPGDLEKQMQAFAGAVGKSSLAQPRESSQLREQVRNQVKEHLAQNSPEARAARRRAEELETLEREQARYVLAQADPKYAHISLQDPLITQTLKDLREAREALEAQANQQYEKLSFRKKDLADNVAAPQVNNDQQPVNNQQEGVNQQQQVNNDQQPPANNPQQNADPQANQNQQPAEERVAADAKLRERVAAMKDSMRGYADQEEYKDRKPDEVIEVDESVANKRFELTDGAVLKEATDRADVRILMEKENAQRRQERKREQPINEFTLGRRLSELRAAQKQLTTEDKTPALTSDEVVQKAQANRAARAERLRGPITEMLQAQAVYAKERGLEIAADGQWSTVKIPGVDFGQAVAGGRNAMKKTGTLEPFYRSKEVQDRYASLLRARESLGPDYKNLPLTDNEVIKKDYELSRKDPVKYGIQDPNSFTEEQRKEYNERLQVIDYLRTAEGENVNPVTSRDDYNVEKELTYRRSLRNAYEQMEGVTEADKNLPLNDPRFYAMQLLQTVCRVENQQQWCGAAEYARLAPQIQGMKRDQAMNVAREFFLHPEAQMQQQQPQVQEQQPQLQGPPMG